ncbi:hypothetical protein CBL_10137 [Carabus blaptoides fortunei]
MIHLQDQQVNTTLNDGSEDDDLWICVEASRKPSSCSENDENSNMQSVQLKNEINTFIPAVKGCIENFFGRPFKPNSENNHRVLLSEWNRFLHLEKGLQGTSVIESPKNYEYISEFIKWPQSRLGNVD